VSGPVRQLPLDLPVDPSHGREDFLVSPSNERAFVTFERWPDWPDRVLLLVGPAGSGKSHLGAIWAERAGALRLQARSLAVAELPELVRRPLLLEDADAPGVAETAFFHLLNLVRDQGSWLVVTASRLPDTWGLQTADLLSRLRLAPYVEMGPPDDFLVKAVLVKLFTDRQLLVETSVIDYVALRIERSLEAAQRVVAALDREALAQGRRVTRPMAGEVLRRLEDLS
jgi:chromosomal replication initiation ATPase DnaA